MGRDKRAEIPMQSIMDFAITSARRESEICRIEWRDNDETARTGMVRDAKHPTGKDGNHRRFKYTPEAWALVAALPKTRMNLRHVSASVLLIPLSFLFLFYRRPPTFVTISVPTSPSALCR